MTTRAQHERNAHRGLNGKFIKNPCEFCGKGCPMNYFSEGAFTVLHERCAAKLAELTTEENDAMWVLVQNIRGAW